METATDTPNQVGDPWGRAAALALAYIIAWVALWHASDLLSLATGVSLWYPPAGLTFALLLKYGAWALPLPMIASLIAGLSLWSWEQWPYYLLANLIPPLGYAATAHMLRNHPVRPRQEQWYFNDPQRVAMFLAAAAGGSLFAALSGVAVLRSARVLPDQPSLPEITLGWWVGDFIGVVTLAPLVLIFASPLARQFRRGEPLRLPKSSSLMDWPAARLVVAQTVLSVLLLLASFWFPYRLWPDQPQPFLSLLLLPVLTWIAATHGMRGTVLTVFLYELGIVTMTVLFGQDDLTLHYQIVMATLVASGLLTGAVSHARFAEIARFRDLAEVSNDLLWEFDTAGHLRDLRGCVIGTTEPRDIQWGASWRNYVISQKQDTDLAALKTALRQRQPFQQLVLRMRLPGQERAVWTRNSGLPLFDEEGEFLGYRGTTTDITDRKQAEVLRKKAEAIMRDYHQALEARVEERTRKLTEASQRNWQLANYDSLTSLPNRNLLFEHLRKDLRQAQRQEWLLGVLMVDLDGFKQVNDTLGHDMGDELLRQVAERLRQCVRATDTAARLGGDEFVIVLPDLEHPDAATTVARKIIARLTEPVPLGKANPVVTASIGIALYRPGSPANLDRLMTLLRQADAAMYAAKRAGKNCWRFADELEQETSMRSTDF